MDSVDGFAGVVFLRHDAALYVHKNKRPQTFANRFLARHYRTRYNWILLSPSDIYTNKPGRSI